MVVAGQIVKEEIDGDEGDVAGGYLHLPGRGHAACRPGWLGGLPRFISPSIAETHVSRVSAGALDAHTA
jgi:hypothetical protein